MINKAEIKICIWQWLANYRPDMLEGGRRDDELEELLYKSVVSELINDSFVNFSSEQDILNSESSVVVSYINSVLSSNYAYSIYSIVDSVWSEEYPDSYAVRSRLGILQTEIISYVLYYERKGITIDNILDSPMEDGLARMEAADNGIQYFSEEQFRQIVAMDIFKDENAH